MGTTASGEEKESRFDVEKQAKTTTTDVEKDLNNGDLLLLLNKNYDQLSKVYGNMVEPMIWFNLGNMDVSYTSRNILALPFIN